MLAWLLLAGLLCAPTSAFLELTSTKCNLDPRRGELTNPCQSLYDAECGGRWCRCPPGTIIHEGLRRCVPGGPGLTNRGRLQNDAQAEWEDLPFDFENDDDDKLADGVLVGGRCSKSKPCVEGAMCSREGHCVCPAGTKSTSSKTGCDKMNSQNSHDHAGHDHDHDKDGNSATTPGASPLLFGIFALFYVL